MMLVVMETQQLAAGRDNHSSDFYDVVIVGGGPAGLSAALMLGRACRSVLVIDSAEPRNAPAAHMHGFPSQDGTPPGDFLTATREQLGTYDITVIDAMVRTVERASDGFRVALTSDREVQARRLLACSGVTDVLPDVPGLRDLWGRDVIHCPYCHGWEVRGRRIGVLASAPMSVHQALLFRQWTDQLTLLLHTQDAPTGQQADELAARGICIITGEVAQVETTNGRLSGVRLANGDHAALDVIAVAPLARPRADFLAPLGLTPQPHSSGMGEHIRADQTGHTTIDGVWVAGNLTEPALNVLGSANSGAIAAGAINADLIAEDTEHALREARPV